MGETEPSPPTRRRTNAKVSRPTPPPPPSSSTRMKAGYQPYGRVSSRGEPRRGAGLDLRVAVLMVFPVICLVVVLYEFLYLQEYAANGAAVDAPVEERSLHLRADQEAASTPAPEPTQPPSIVNGRRTIILVANYRDSARCSSSLSRAHAQPRAVVGKTLTDWQTDCVA